LISAAITLTVVTITTGVAWIIGSGNTLIIFWVQPITRSVVGDQIAVTLAEYTAGKRIQKTTTDSCQPRRILSHDGIV